MRRHCGTSVSAPHVSDVAALIIGKHGGEMDAAQVKAIIEQSAGDLGKPGMDDYYGRGRINACTAVTGIKKAPAMAEGEWDRWGNWRLFGQQSRLPARFSQSVWAEARNQLLRPIGLIRGGDVWKTRNWFLPHELGCDEEVMLAEL